MNFAGDAHALFFAAGLQPGGQGTQRFLHVPAFHPLFGLAEGAAHHLSQPIQVLLQDAIGGAGFQAFHRQFLADGARNQHERRLRLELSGVGQGGQAAVRRKRIIRQNQIELSTPERCFIFFPGSGVDKFAPETLRRQRFHHQLPVIRIVLQAKNAQPSALGRLMHYFRLARRPLLFRRRFHLQRSAFTSSAKAIELKLL